MRALLGVSSSSRETGTLSRSHPRPPQASSSRKPRSAQPSPTRETRPLPRLSIHPPVLTGGRCGGTSRGGPPPPLVCARPRARPLLAARDSHVTLAIKRRACDARAPRRAHWLRRLRAGSATRSPRSRSLHGRVWCPRRRLYSRRRPATTTAAPCPAAAAATACVAAASGPTV